MKLAGVDRQVFLLDNGVEGLVGILTGGPVVLERRLAQIKKKGDGTHGRGG